MKVVVIVESISKSNMDFRVRNKNRSRSTNIIIKIPAVFGLLSKLKNGPIIVKINPNVDEMKNLGNRNVFSQKSGIF